MALLDDGNTEFSFDNMTTALSGFMQQMAGLANDQEIVGNATAVGEALSGSIGSGMSNASGKVSSAAAKIPGKITSVFSSNYNNFVNIGKAIDMGIAKGIADNDILVTNAIEQIILEAEQAARDAGLIESPSKLFARIGMYIDQGLALGIRDYSGSVTDATSSMINESANNLKTGLSLLSDSLNLPIDDRPTIRPVLDLTDVTAGVAGMNGLFGNRTIGVTSSGMATSIANTRYSRLNQPTSNVASDSGDVSRAISVLNEKMGSLETAISNMKVVTETGALIGQIARGMDNKLGQYSRMHERGA